MRARGGRARNLALAEAAPAALLLLLECASRLLLDPPRYHEGPVEFHPALGFRGVPGHRGEAVDELGPFLLEVNSQACGAGRSRRSRRPACFGWPSWETPSWLGRSCVRSI